MTNRNIKSAKQLLRHIPFFTISIITLLLLNGCCFIPAVTHCNGTISIQAGEQPSKQKISSRYILISLWDFPQVNDSKGKVDINEVIVTEESKFTLDFPFKGYWILWTPALRTQHLAPEPAIMIFHNDYPLEWFYGRSVIHPELPKLCCEKPETRLNFSIVLDKPKESLSEIQKDHYRIFFEKFLEAKEPLIKEMNKCKDVTKEEKNMVLEKINTCKKELGI